MIKVNDFVILTESTTGIETNSVGFVEEISGSKAEVFFIGRLKKVLIDVSRIKFLDVNKTGKTYKYKICNVCHILKEDYKDFDINQTDASGRKTTRPTCTECRKIIDGAALKPSERKRIEVERPKPFLSVQYVKKLQSPV